MDAQAPAASMAVAHREHPGPRDQQAPGYLPEVGVAGAIILAAFAMMLRYMASRSDKTVTVNEAPKPEAQPVNITNGYGRLISEMNTTLVALKTSMEYRDRHDDERTRRDVECHRELMATLRDLRDEMRQNRHLA